MSVKGKLCDNRITLMDLNAITRTREYCNYISIPWSIAYHDIAFLRLLGVKITNMFTTHCT